MELNPKFYFSVSKSRGKDHSFLEWALGSSSTFDCVPTLLIVPLLGSIENRRVGLVKAKVDLMGFVQSLDPRFVEENSSERKVPAMRQDGKRPCVAARRWYRSWTESVIIMRCFEVVFEREWMQERKERNPSGPKDLRLWDESDSSERNIGSHTSLDDMRRTKR